MEPAFLKKGAAAFLFLVPAFCLAAAASGDAPTLALTDRLGEPPRREFTCQEPIYAELLFPTPLTGRHRLLGEWRRPDGRVQETTVVPLDLSGPGASSFNLWLRFHSQMSVWEAMWWGGTAGGEESPFNGEWKLRVTWDGREVARAAFSVTCP